VDGNLRQLNAAGYIELLKKEKPDWLVMEPSALTYKEDLKVALALKGELGTKLVFCGQQPSAFPEMTLKDGVDYACIGEYEYTVLDIVRGEDPARIKGLYPNPRRELLDVNSLPFPEDDDISRWDYINIAGSRYKEIEVFASRGCPMSCVFCVCRHLYYAEPNWRPRAAASIIEEIKYLRKKYPEMEGIFFDEEEHNAGKHFIMDLTKAIRASGLGDLKYNAMCGYWTLDEEMLEAMHGAGYYKLRVGIETASRTIAKGMHKNIDIPRLKRALLAAKRIGMEMYGTFTVGAPLSTQREDRKTIGLIKELLERDLLCDAQISICTPQPGTPFFSWAEREGYLISRNWRDYDGYTRAVVNYPGYSNRQIEETFSLANLIYNKAVERRRLLKTGLLGFIRSKISEYGVLRALRKALEEFNIQWMIRP
jgi:radical SAM superfamily enzyme YgiQ (UPF0313 family)